MDKTLSLVHVSIDLDLFKKLLLMLMMKREFGRLYTKSGDFFCQVLYHPEFKKLLAHDRAGRYN